MQIWPKIVISGALAVGTMLLSGTGSAFATSVLNSTAVTDSLGLSARIVSAQRSLQCVPYARNISGIPIRGNAWTWWRATKNRYEHKNKPRAGAVLVMKKTSRLRLGHLAVVRRIVGKRTIIVDHANWLNRGRIHLGTAVRDVSPKNDWSAVRVWYTPGSRFGSGTYPAYGFIYAAESEARTARPSSLPIPRRRPAAQAFLNTAPRPAGPAALLRHDVSDIFIGKRHMDPQIRPRLSKPAQNRPRDENLLRDTWHLDSRRG